MKWATFDVENRKNFFSVLFRNIKLENLSHEFLKHLASDQVMLFKNLLCRGLSISINSFQWMSNF